MRERGEVKVVDDQIGTPTSVLSLATAVWQFALRPDLSGVFHWTDAGVASWYDFAVAVAEEGHALSLLGEGSRVLPIPTESYPTPAQRPKYSVLDKRLTISALGLNPMHWRQQLRTVLQELRGA
jgi:dTDP-4-dehydrorhamnose reductase